MMHVIRIGVGVFTLVLIGASPALPATPAHKAVQYGEQALAFSSGFIRDDVPSDGVVAKPLTAVKSWDMATRCTCE